MSMRDRLSKLWRSRRSGTADAGDLKERLDETYRTQAALLQQVRRGVADVLVSRKRVDVQIATIEQQAARLEEQARASIAAGNDDDARAALTRKITLEKTAADLLARRDDLKAQEDTLQRQALTIEQDVESFRVRKDTLAARHSAASARAEINSATSGINSTVSEVGQAMADAERRTRELEARADAADELVAEGVVGRSGESADEALARQFDAVLGQDALGQDAMDSAEVDRQLEQLTTDQEGDDGAQPIQR
jgi:phage shock protein A